MSGAGPEVVFGSNQRPEGGLVPFFSSPSRKDIPQTSDPLLSVHG